MIQIETMVGQTITNETMVHQMGQGGSGRGHEWDQGLVKRVLEMIMKRSRVENAARVTKNGTKGRMIRKKGPNGDLSPG
jgi:hypothetical protein